MGGANIGLALIVLGVLVRLGEVIGQLVGAIH
jgi:hypothetical protein